MGLFDKLKNDGLEETNDRLGGYQPLETGVYTGKIKLAYAGQSAGGAQNVTLLVDLGQGREYRETVYVTNKAGENWFPNKDDPKKKVPLPGFTVIDDICLVTTGKPLAEQDVEERIAKIYDVTEKKEINKSVPVLVELLGLEVSLGIGKLLENKSVKQGDEYVPSAETRVSNVIEKVFHTETRMTVVEARNGVEKAAFWDAWEERNKGQVRDKRTIKDGQAGANGGPPMGGFAGRPGNRAPGAPPMANGQAGAAAAAPRKSLFGSKPAA